jgi:hypothetical protein
MEQTLDIDSDEVTLEVFGKNRVEKCDESEGVECSGDKMERNSIQSTLNRDPDEPIHEFSPNSLMNRVQTPGPDKELLTLPITCTNVSGSIPEETKTSANVDPFQQSERSGCDEKYLPTTLDTLSRDTNDTIDSQVAHENAFDCAVSFNDSMPTTSTGNDLSGESSVSTLSDRKPLVPLELESKRIICPVQHPSLSYLEDPNDSTATVKAVPVQEELQVRKNEQVHEERSRPSSEYTRDKGAHKPMKHASPKKLTLSKSDSWHGSDDEIRLPKLKPIKPFISPMHLSIPIKRKETDFESVEPKRSNDKLTVADIEAMSENDFTKLRISLLHEYNKVKDIGQMLLGLLAQKSGQTVKDMYERYDLDLED